jgi:hypothetical protein
MYLQERVVERTVRQDRRWDVDVRDGGGKPGNDARVVWRSLDVDQHIDVEPAEKGQHDNNNEEDCGDGSGEV